MIKDSHKCQYHS